MIAPPPAVREEAAACRRQCRGRAAAVWLLLALGMSWPPTASAQSCGTAGVQVQVLGSGGPELADRRAASSYLVWIEGKPRVLVDIGGGAALRFGESGARIADLDAILLTHLHADHTADLPALIESSSFEDRTRPLPLYGPGGNRFMPSTVAFVRTLFDNTRGAYRYLGDFLSPLAKDGYKLEPHDVREKPPKIGVPRRPPGEILPAFGNERLRAAAVSVGHGQFPALAWRLEAGGRRIAFSGDTNGEGGYLEKLAQGADLLVAHHAVPEDATAGERNLHMPPSVIGKIARASGTKQLVLTHRTRRTLGKEEETLAVIRKNYGGPVAFANDLDCFPP
jgi:ribonuclease BN (tRNA processing enzyme)